MKNQNWQQIEDKLNEEFKDSFKNISDFDVNETIKIFLEIMKNQKIALTHLVEGLHIRYVDNSFDNFGYARENLATSIEKYFDTLYQSLVTPVSGTMGAKLNKFFMDIDPTFWQNEKNNFLCGPNNPNPSVDLVYFDSLTPFGDKFKLIYDLRNNFTHRPPDNKIHYPGYVKDITNKNDYASDIQDCIIVYLYITYKYIDQLKEYLSKQQSYDFTAYLQTVKNNFRERIGRFVHLEGKEDIQLSNAYVVEQREDIDEDDEITERRGTVECLRKNEVPEKRMMLWGEAGMGKTTTLEYLSYQDAEDCLQDLDANIPVYISLGLMTDKNVSIKQHIFNKLDIDEEVGELFLQQGRINLFLDAINEIPQDDNNQLRTYRQREIANLLKTYPKVFIILSNRPQDTNIFPSVPVFMLQKMDDAQIAAFLERNATNEQVRQKIEGAIEADERLKSIIKTPFMLSRLIEVVNRKGEIPTNKGDIIHEFIQGLYIREQIEKKDANFNQKTIHRLLRFLGYESLEKKGTNAGLTEDDVLNIFVKCKNEYGFQVNTVYVLEIATQLGILERSEGLYVFSHQEYQDYYHFEQERAILEGKL